MRNSNWTEPKLTPLNPKPADMLKTWRVWFRYYYNGKDTLISRRCICSPSDTFSRRLYNAKLLIEVLKRDLKSGWNPITDTYPALDSKALELERIQNMGFDEALDYAYLKKKPEWSHKTGQDYSSCIKYLKKGWRESGIFKPVREFKKTDFRLILEETVRMRKYTPEKFNKYRTLLSALITELIQWDVLEANPIFYIKTKEVLKKVSHRPPLPGQRKTIIDKIKADHRDYYRFIAVLYGCSIRPKEITRLKIKDLKMEDNIFRLPAEITKTGQEKDVPVPNWLIDVLQEMNLDYYSPEFFLFSGKGNMFLPGPKQMHSNSPTTYWKKIVKKGLKMNVNQYSLKKMAGNDMVLLQTREGLDNLLELPKQVMRHSSTKQTEVYVTAHNDVFKDLIVHKMPRL